MKVDIVVIAHSEELELLRLQARSIASYFDPYLINKYIVIWNDTSPVSEVKEILLNDTRDLHNILEVLPRSDFLQNADLYTGWRVQQVLKVLAARIATSDFLYVLDSKNHFIRPVQQDDLFDADGKPFTILLDYNGDIFEEHARNCLKYFGRTNPASPIPLSLPTVTPFMQYREVLNSMAATIEMKESKGFARCFLDMQVFKKATEFLLYNAHCIVNYDLDALYVVQEKIFYTLFKSTATISDEKSTARLKFLDNEKCKVFGLHSKRIGTLRPREMHVITQAWRSAGFLPFTQRIGLHQKLASRE